MIGLRIEVLEFRKRLADYDDLADLDDFEDVVSKYFFYTHFFFQNICIEK